MAVRVEVVSIGTLSRNQFWGETGNVRPSHATTTLIRDGSTSILVDPSLPGEVLEHRLFERMGMVLKQIDAVFLTNFRPVHRRGLSALTGADWLVAPAERETIAAHLNAMLETELDQDSMEEVDQELVMLGRTKPADDRLTASVHLFPTPG